MVRTLRIPASAAVFFVMVSLSGGCGGDVTGVQPDQSIRLTRLELGPAAASVPKGGTLQLKVTGHWSDGASSDVSDAVTWTASSPEFAVVDEAGLVTGLTPGEASFVARKGELSATGTVTVTAAKVVALTFLPGRSKLAVGSAQQLSVAGDFSDGSTQDVTSLVTWRAVNPEIGSVSGTGWFTAVSAGTATITAAIDDVEASTSIEVVVSRIVSLEITPGRQSVAKGRFGKLTVTAHLSDDLQADYTAMVDWSSYGEGEVTIDAEGRVVGVSEGRVTVRATHEEFEGEARVDVGPAELEGIAFSSATLQLGFGKTLALEALGSFSDEAVTPVVEGLSWKSLDTSVVTVDDQGVVTGVDHGTTTVTATKGNLSASVEITVSPTVIELRLTPATASVPKGRLIEIALTGVMSDGPEVAIDLQDAVWTSSNEQVARAYGNPHVTTHGVGAATVTAQYEGLTASMDVTVTEKVIESLEFVPPNPLLQPGGWQVGVKLDGVYSDGTTIDLTHQAVWKSEDESVLVADKGAMTSRSVGVTEIRVEAEGLTASTVGRVFDGPLAYLGNRSYAGKVAVLDPSTHELLTEIPTPNGVTSLVTHPSQQWIFGVQPSSSELLVIDKRVNRVASFGPDLGSTIQQVMLSADGTRLYVRTMRGELKVVPAASDTSWTVASLSSMGTFVIDEENEILYAAERNFFAGKLYAIDLYTLKELAPPVEIGGASSILPGASFERAWVHNHGSPVVKLVDLTSLTVEKEITLDWGGARPNLSRDGKKLYVAEQYGRRIAVIPTATGEVTKTLDVGFDIERMWTLKGASRLFVAGFGRMAVINTVDDSVIESHTLGDSSVLTIGESTTFDVVYAPGDGAASLFVFDNSSGALIGRTRVPSYASDVLFTEP